MDRTKERVMTQFYGVKGNHSQLEVNVHTSLPPLVEGKLRGHLGVCLEGVEWMHNVRPPVPRLSVRLCWWGETGPATVFRVPVQPVGSAVSKPRCAYYPIRSGLAQIKAYLRDTGALQFEVGVGHMRDASMVIGRATVGNLTALYEDGSMSGTYAILSLEGVLLGQLRLKFQLHMKPLLIGRKGGVAKEEDVEEDVVSQNMASSGPEEGGISLSPQFVVGAGASFKKAHRAGTFGSPPTAEGSRKEMEGKKNGMESKRLPLIGGTVRLYADTLPEAGANRLPLYSAADLWREEGQKACESTLAIGPDQMAVIGELIERGTRLRDKMVHSLMGGDQLEHRPGRGGEETETMATNQDLALMSAKLAEKKRMGEKLVGWMGQTFSHRKAEILYNSLSSDELAAECSSGDEEVVRADSHSSPGAPRENMTSGPDRVTRETRHKHNPIRLTTRKKGSGADQAGIYGNDQRKETFLKSKQLREDVREEEEREEGTLSSMQAAVSPPATPTPIRPREVPPLSTDKHEVKRDVHGSPASWHLYPTTLAERCAWKSCIVASLSHHTGREMCMEVLHRGICIILSKEVILFSYTSKVLSGATNCYLVCRLFCIRPEPARTAVMWATDNPHFHFRQCFPLQLSTALLRKLCHNLCIVEVWNHAPLKAMPHDSGPVTHDELVGLVKLSMHQFFLAYCEPASVSISTQTKLPVVSVDAYCPIVEPITGQISGHLGVLLAMGTPEQIAYLLKEHGAGTYALHPPLLRASTAQRTQDVKTQRAEDTRQQPCFEKLPCGSTPGPSSGPDELMVDHEFVVCVCGVSGMSVEAGMVWGEADCYVQYHFPTLITQPSVSEERSPAADHGVKVCLEAYRTSNTLYVLGPRLDHRTCHTLTLSRDQAVGQILAKACGHSGLSGVIPFELWRRFYQPNIRDQLLAKAGLPLVKLCALVGMHLTSSKSSTHTFSLPLTCTSATAAGKDEGADGGELQVTVSYSALLKGTTSTQREGKVQAIGGRIPSCGHPQPRLLHLTLNIIRMAGLKRAALLASRQHPLGLDVAAEIGVSAYATIRTTATHILPKPLTTKAVPRSFAPELRQVFELTLSLTEEEEGLACELMYASLLLEVWHQMAGQGGQTPQKDAADSAHDSAKDVLVEGRRLEPSFQDVLLGVAHVPLVDLLSYTGVHGWYPLLPMDSSLAAPVSGPVPNLSHLPLVVCAYVGAVELSAAFTSTRDRELLLSSARTCGWKAPCLQPVTGTAEGEEGSWQVEVRVPGLWAQRKASSGMWTDPPPLAFIRYRFFDLEPVTSTPTYMCDGISGEGACYYQLQHKAHILIPSSKRLEWYLCEEKLEIQVWLCSSASRPSHSRLCSSASRPAHSRLCSSACRPAHSRLCSSASRPAHSLLSTGQHLLGSVYISLVDLLSPTSAATTSRLHTVSAWYPVFKAGAEELSQHALYVEVCMTPSTEPQAGSKLVVLESMGEEELAHAIYPTVAGEDGISKGDDMEEEMFEVELVLHQALHLPVLHENREQGMGHCAYVKVPLHPGLEKLSSPAAPPGLRPVWDYHVNVHIPVFYLQAECPGLELQVWSRDPGGEGLPDYCIGRAMVDVSPLACGLAQLNGWYHIWNQAGEIQGQLKVSVVPVDRSALVPPPSSLPQSSLWSSICPPPCLPASMSSTSLLYQQLRENIHDLDLIKCNLQTKLLRTGPHLNISHLSHAQERETRVALAGCSNGRSTALHPDCTVSPGVCLHLTDVEISPHQTGAYNVRPSGTLHAALTAVAEREEDTDTLSLSAVSSVTVNYGRQSSDSCSINISSEMSSLTEFNEKDEQNTSTEVKGVGGESRSGDEEGGSLFDKIPQHQQGKALLHDRSPQQCHDVSLCDGSLPQHLDSTSRNRKSPQHLDSFLQTSPQHPQHQSISQNQVSPSCSDLSPQHDSHPQHQGSSQNHNQVSPSCSDLSPQKDQGHPPCPDALQQNFPTHHNSQLQDILQQQNSSNTAKQQDLVSDEQDNTLTYISSPAIAHTARVPVMQSLPEPQLPNFFLSPQQLEQSLRVLRARALTRPPPPQLLPAVFQARGSNIGKEAERCSGHTTQTSVDMGTGTEARRMGIPGYRRRTPSETKRIHDIFSSS